MHLLSGEATPSSESTAGREVPAPAEREKIDGFARLSAEVAELRSDVTELRQQFAAFRKQFE
ncbi:MAG: hypothetical protein QOG55_2662 [Acidobacteriaceae bacterium]|jgi:hypothetical protein|nr:hypothetical protein [Acidobacteriaceae bacterium]